MVDLKAALKNKEKLQDTGLVEKGKVGLYVTGSQSTYNLTSGSLIISLIGEPIDLAERNVVLLYQFNKEHKGRKRATLVDAKIAAEVVLDQPGWKTYNGLCRYVVLRHNPPIPAIIVPSQLDAFSNAGLSYFYDRDSKTGRQNISEFVRYNIGHVVFENAVMTLPEGRYMAAKVGESIKVGEDTRLRSINYTVLKNGRYRVSDPDERKLLREVYDFPLDNSDETIATIMDTLEKFNKLGNGVDKDNVLGAPVFDEFYRNRLLSLEDVEAFLNGA